jgi:hypothetical protein
MEEESSVLSKGVIYFYGFFSLISLFILKECSPIMFDLFTLDFAFFIFSIYMIFQHIYINIRIQENLKSNKKIYCYVLANVALLSVVIIVHFLFFEKISMFTGYILSVYLYSIAYFFSFLFYWLVLKYKRKSFHLLSMLVFLVIYLGVSFYIIFSFIYHNIGESHLGKTSHDVEEVFKD